MTSEGYWLQEQWSPLSQSARKWEEAANGSTQLPFGEAEAGVHGDRLPWAAVVDKQLQAHTNVRPDAPHVRETHFWGMRND